MSPNQVDHKPQGPLGLAALRTLQSEGRYLFRAPEFAKLTKRDPQTDAVALKRALNRLSARGMIVSLSRRPSTWLIVPAEHDHFGAPPVGWWLDDYLHETEPNYYLALLSAARHWGSSHYARQTTQVMVSKPRRQQRVGKIALDFSVKVNIKETPVVKASTTVSHVRVSTREATLLDLVRHQTQVGGIEAAARVAKDFAASLEQHAMRNALDALDQRSAAQRLGFILEALHLDAQASWIAQWLNGRVLQRQDLDATSTGQGAMLEGPRWRLRYSRQQRQLLAEL